MSAFRLLPALLGGLGIALAARRAWRLAHGLDFRGRTVVITGGSRGLGLVLARLFAEEGARVALFARDEAELELARVDLEARQAPAVLALSCDLRDADQIRAALDRVATELGGVDVLINNAGIMHVGPLEHMTVADFDEAMAIHFWGPLHAMLAALPHLRRSGAARIVNISSIGGRVAVPHMAPYTASKFALTGLSDAFRAELAAEGIRVTTVCPGPMRTGSPLHAVFKGRHTREFAWFAISAALPLASIDARRAARQILEACRQGDAELVITPQARFAIVLNALCPGTMAWATALVSQLLPAPADGEGPGGRAGHRSRPGWLPSVLTRLADRAAARNNEFVSEAARPSPLIRAGA